MTFILTGHLTQATADRFNAKRRFAISYNQQSGWEPSDAPIVQAIQERINEGVEDVDHLPIPTIPRLIAATLTGAESQVISTVVALMDEFVDDGSIKLLNPSPPTNFIY